MEPKDQAPVNRIEWYPLAFGLIAVGGAAAAFGPAFVGTQWVVAVVVAVTVSGAVMAWTVATDTGVIQSTVISAVAALVTTSTTVLYDSLGNSVGATIDDFFTGLTTGWNDSLQEDLPLVEPTLPLVWVTVMIWISAAIVARALAAGRTSLPVFLAPTILLALATAITVPAGTPSRWPVAIVTIGLLGILATTSAREIDWSWGQVRAAAFVIAIATAAGVVAMPWTPSDPEGAFDPRDLRSDNASEEEVPDLFARLDEIVSADPDPALNLQLTDGTRPTRLRLAVYDEYDGERWSTTTTFEEILQFTAPDALPPGEPSRVQVQVLESPGPWLPLLDRVTNIRPSVRGWDEESGTALAEATIATVQGTVITPSDRASVTTAATDVDERYTALPSATPSVLLDLAATRTAESPDAASAVTELRDAVLEIGRDDSVPVGHTLGRLASDVENSTAMAPEQLVALHATLVRAVGIPSRIVVGYVVGDEDEVTTADMAAWTEVAFAGVGWVPFNPVPAEQISVEGGEGGATASTTTLPGQAVTEAQVVPRELGAGERISDDVDRPTGSSIGAGEIALITGASVLVLMLIIVFSRAWRRRRRRRASSAPWSIAGAWGELLDRLRENHGPAPANRTVEEAIDQVEGMAPQAASSLREFNKLVNVMLYSDTPPNWDDAEDAWGLLRDIEGHLRAERGRSVTVRARIDPRSLRYPTPRPSPNRARRPHPPRVPRTDHPRVQR